MTPRPQVVAFDVLETLFSLEPLRGRLEAAGLPPESLELWFSQTLRTGFVLAVTEGFAPLPEVAAGTLRDLLARHGRPADDATAAGVLEGFGELTPQDDLGPALRLLRQRGVRALALTNGSAAVTRGLFRRAGLEDLVERVVSIDDVRQWKPRREVYLHAARTAGVEPARVALVAAHAWDVHGARRAGLAGAWVRRKEKLYPSYFEPPDVRGDTLTEVCQTLAEFPAG